MAKIHGHFAPRPTDEISESISCVEAVVVDTICVSSRFIKLLGGKGSALQKSDLAQFDDARLVELAAALAQDDARWNI